MKHQLILIILINFVSFAHASLKPDQFVKFARDKFGVASNLEAQEKIEACAKGLLKSGAETSDALNEAIRLKAENQVQKDHIAQLESELTTLKSIQERAASDSSLLQQDYDELLLNMKQLDDDYQKLKKDYDEHTLGASCPITSGGHDSDLVKQNDLLLLKLKELEDAYKKLEAAYAEHTLGASCPIPVKDTASKPSCPDILPKVKKLSEQVNQLVKGLN